MNIGLFLTVINATDYQKIHVSNDIYILVLLQENTFLQECDRH